MKRNKLWLLPMFLLLLAAVALATTTINTPAASGYAYGTAYVVNITTDVYNATSVTVKSTDASGTTLCSNTTQNLTEYTCLWNTTALSDSVITVWANVSNATINETDTNTLIYIDNTVIPTAVHPTDNVVMNTSAYSASATVTQYNATNFTVLWKNASGTVMCYNDTAASLVLGQSPACSINTSAYAEGNWSIYLKTTSTTSGLSGAKIVTGVLLDNTAPTCNASASDGTGSTSIYEFDTAYMYGYGSSDTIGLSTYAWDFSNTSLYDGSASTVNATNRYDALGTYYATLTCTDYSGYVSTDVLTITVLTEQTSGNAGTTTITPTATPVVVPTTPAAMSVGGGEPGVLASIKAGWAKLVAWLKGFFIA